MYILYIYATVIKYKQINTNSHTHTSWKHSKINKFKNFHNYIACFQLYSNNSMHGFCSLFEYNFISIGISHCYDEAGPII